MKHHLPRLILALLLLGPGFSGFSQVYLYFQDSPSNDYYDYSWMDLTAPSSLERKGTDLRKFPVESAIAPVQGLNSLRLNWTSESGGYWDAIAAGDNWTEKDISHTDTLMFWLYSVEGLSKANLPALFMEDITNAKTTHHDFSAWSNDLPAGVWVRVTVPMSLFLDAGDAVDFTKIKTIGFAQNAADGAEHTLFIDNMRIFEGSTYASPVNPPTGVSAVPYDSHIEVNWIKNPLATGYSIQRAFTGTNIFSTIHIASADDTLYDDFVGDHGTPTTAEYRIAALNGSGEAGVPSDTVTATTRLFTSDELLTMVEQYTFRYFWDFAHPASGMIRERNTSGNTVTTGGTGFGIMALLVGIERNFITRDQGIARMQKILDFLATADRFHGAWPHWMDGNTGHVIPFSQQDDGGDLVETGFLMEGLLTARQYFNRSTPEEESIVQKITTLWEGVEWDWYRQNGSDVLYWHWSPDYGWAINMQIRGWNEAAIIYILAIASPTHGVPADLWDLGWAGSGDYQNGKTFYGYKLDVGWDNGGPLFFAHYSFLGFDPRNKKDAYANYFVNNRNHTLINRAYCIANPLGFDGYGENCWGLTASDDPDGYLAHQPGSGTDNGTITPTAAISSIPYTPAESQAALTYLYRNLGKKIWGSMGFHDAFNITRNWYADSYLAIDQGPIIDMIENYRTQLLWNNFMADPEIRQALTNIGFTEDNADAVIDLPASYDLQIWPNPARNDLLLRFTLDKPDKISVLLTDPAGREIYELIHMKSFPAGISDINLHRLNLKPGSYLLILKAGAGKATTRKLIIYP